MVTLTARRRALTLVPVAAFSAAATVGAVRLAPPPVPQLRALVAPTTGQGIPPAVAVPRAAGAASATAPTTGVRPVLAQQSLTSDPTAAIPEPALVAYQRAASVLAGTTPGCSLDWTLLAAIGEVESDHGRAGAGNLTAEGVREPALVGPVIQPEGEDTDGGAYDGDPAHDRAIGPLLLVPATWSSVKVDGDSDGVRDPQDVDDAALAAAVFLCSAGDDLATSDGRRVALARYNPDPGYTELVLAWARAYSAPGPLPEAAVLAAAVPVEVRAARPRHRDRPATSTATPEPVRPVAPDAPPSPSAPATPAQPSPARPNPVRDALTVTGANLLCTLDGLSRLLQPEPFRACVDRRLHRTP